MLVDELQVYEYVKKICHDDEQDVVEDHDYQVEAMDVLREVDVVDDGELHQKNMVTEGVEDDGDLDVEDGGGLGVVDAGDLKVEDGGGLDVDDDNDLDLVDEVVHNHLVGEVNDEDEHVLDDDHDDKEDFP